MPEAIAIEEDSDNGSTNGWDYNEALKQFSREFVTRALCWTGGNKRKAAKLMGISHARLYRIIQQVGL